MAQECGFFNAELEGGEYDRVYNAEQFAAYFASFIGNGIFGNSMSELVVVENETPNMSVNISSGKAWINGWWYRNTEDYNLSVDVADGILNRIDIVVLRWGNVERDMWLQVVKGTPSTEPTAPSITRDADYYDLKLCEISVPAGAINIRQAQITDTRAISDVCGFVTGLIDQIDAADLFLQFQAQFGDFMNVSFEEFDVWFQHMKDQLSEDAAGHLQAEIDNIVDEIGDGDISEIGDGTVKGAILVLSSAGVVGSMTIFAGSVIPDGYLLCDGQAVSRTDYADLFAVIGTTWGAGDGSTTFNIPDMREVAPVGVGQSERTEGAHDVFALGEFKDDQVQDHTQSVSTSGGNHNHVQTTNGQPASAGSSFSAWNALGTSGGYNSNYATAYSGNLSMSGSATTITAGRHGNTTRGKRIGVNYIIKY